MKPLVFAISGSTKTNSTSQRLINYIQVKYAGVFDLRIFDGIAKLPHFNPELEAELPNQVAEFRALIESADGLLFVSPEYVFSLPGSLKNAIEWLVSTVLLSRKPTATIIAAASGLKAQESLNLILRTLETILPENSTGLIQGAKGKIPSDGNISDQESIETIDTLIKSLLECISNDHKTPSKYQ
ncbi:NADPH-dependent FMN reductase [Portibacter lacus]|uniref:NADPH-dependent FMN reductase-like domain-containing protein n=1 Tax=Portibacter lacus TaxID=1099794 RepID=A0AA37WFZ5_9BACT|nr:NADPH-dependent FMN reductase [Portibacter lacus]GLR19287.1 hypothetical protein GCM10007940_39030 [Portibacter lacus]